MLIAAYAAALLWAQLWIAEAMGAPVQARLDPTLVTLLLINAWLLGWRVFMRACFTHDPTTLILIALDFRRQVSSQGKSASVKDRALWLHRSCRRYVELLHIDLEVIGKPPQGGLMVSNHMGYVDKALAGRELAEVGA